MPLIISQNIVLSEPVDFYSANHPRICFDNVFADGTITASSESGIHYRENVANGNTFDYWVSSASPSWIRVDLPTAREVDFLGIAAHELTGVNSFVLQYWNDSTWIDCHEALSVETNDVIAVIFPVVFASRFRLSINGGEVPIGVLTVGKAFIFERKFYGGHSPINMAKQVDIAHAVSENGYDLGRAVRFNGVATDIVISNLTAPWVRANLLPVADIIKTKPFFFAWRPEKYPTEVAYVWTDDDIKPVNQGLKNFMSLKLSVKGLINSAGY